MHQLKITLSRGPFPQAQEPLVDSFWIIFSVTASLFLSFLSVTYATKQLTHALQELTRRSQQDESQIQPLDSSVISADQLQFSKEVESYLERRQEYSAKTRRVSVGSY